MRSLAGIWRVLALLTLVAAVGIGGFVLLGDRAERAQTQNRLLSSLHVDAQRLHLAALGAALAAKVGPDERRDLRSGRLGMVESIRGLRGWSRHDLSLLRLRNERFSAAVGRELSLTRGGGAERLRAAALEMGARFKQLERIILRLQSRADGRYDAARRERDAALLAILVLALLTSALFAWRANVARRDRAILLGRENARLTEVDRMKEEFVASVSHELRTPLTSIRGYLELVLDGEAGDLTPVQSDYLRIIDRNTNRLLDLINDLLDVAQAESGRLALDRESVDLASLVGDAVDGARPGADARQIKLGLDLATGHQVRVSIDRKRMGQVVDNLLSNAVKFTPNGGTVDVRIVSENGHAGVEVSDTGIGIPEAEQARLFERFFRTEAASGRAVQGTGLGLAISKAIVEAHGGKIAVASAEGVGTTFAVLLPRDDDVPAS